MTQNLSQDVKFFSFSWSLDCKWLGKKSMDSNRKISETKTFQFISIFLLHSQMSGPQWCYWRKQCLEWSGKPPSTSCLRLLGRQKTWHKVYNVRVMMTGWVTSIPVKWKTRLEYLEFTRNTKVGAMDTWERRDTRGSLALEPHRPQQPVWIATIITIININIIIMTIIAILICINMVLPHLQGNIEIGRHKDRNAVGNTKHRIYWN